MSPAWFVAMSDWANFGGGGDKQASGKVCELAAACVEDRALLCMRMKCAVNCM